MSTLLDELLQAAEVQPELKTYRDREESGDAELFSFMFRDRVVFDHAAKAWFLWRGNYWERDRTGEVCRMVIHRLASEYMRAGADALERGDKIEANAFTNRARALWKRRRIDNVLALARNMEGLALVGDEWDLNPIVLGVQNGVIDLEMGIFRAGQPSDYMQNHSPVDWLGLNHPAPNWEQFLIEVFDGDTNLIAFIQRMLGYSITGMTTEHILPILYGEGGRNGKTTMLETLGAVLGRDLSSTTQADALMDVRRDGAGAQPFVHALRGRRLVWATESREGQRINSGLIKQLTGGDSITTRTLFEKPVTFKPTHKVMLLTNFKPHLSAEDQALWDRILLIPFETRFIDNPKLPNERKRKPRLSEMLRQEAAGILAWLVRGCLNWQQEGLNPPAKVKVATEEYRREEDTLSEFYAECLTEGEGLVVQAKDIYGKYVEWTKSNGMEPMSQIALGKRLARRYGMPTRNMRGKIYEGVTIVP